MKCLGEKFREQSLHHGWLMAPVLQGDRFICRNYYHGKICLSHPYLQFTKVYDLGIRGWKLEAGAEVWLVMWLKMDRLDGISCPS